MRNAACEADTIAAVATPPGVSAVSIIRISGPRAHDIARACFVPRSHADPPSQARLQRGWVCDPHTRDHIDDALAAHFFAPRSFTGEDLVELHVHGGAGVISSCLMVVLRLGARLAAPGEFTKRAFLNGRIDLAQAEAVADLIAAETERAAKAAAHRLAGEVGASLRGVREQLLDRLVEIEAHVDYPDEVAQPDVVALGAALAMQLERVCALLSGSRGARILRDGIACVIAGPPNAGKSSLLNALLQAERAIVSDVPGTTRDVIEDRIVVDGVVLRLFDTAGLRKTSDRIEAEGVTRAGRAIDTAELVIVVIDGSQKLDANAEIALEQTKDVPRIVLCNKLDLGSAGFDELEHRFPGLAQGANGNAFIAGSVTWPAAIEKIRQAIATLGWGGAIDANAALVANARQIEALTRAQKSLGDALATIEHAQPIDMVCVDLREAIAACGEVSGDTVTEEVLDGIFSRFCVGK